MLADAERGLSRKCNPELCSFKSQSNELSRGPLRLVSTFVNRGCSHRRKSAACPTFDMVLQYRSPIPVGRRGHFLVQMIFTYTIATCRGRGGGDRHTVF